jgi:hypothetical protein
MGESYTFRIAPKEIPNFKRPVAHVLWGETTDMTADQIVGERPPQDGIERTQAQAFLFATLCTPMNAQEVIALGGKQGIAERTLRRAADQIKVRKVREGFGGGSIWYPPPDTISSHTDLNGTVHSGHSGHSIHALKTVAGMAAMASMGENITSETGVEAEPVARNGSTATEPEAPPEPIRDPWECLAR